MRLRGISVCNTESVTKDEFSLKRRVLESFIGDFCVLLTVGAVNTLLEA